jgi:hypothetical protein
MIGAPANPSGEVLQRIAPEPAARTTSSPFPGLFRDQGTESTGILPFWQGLGVAEFEARTDAGSREAGTQLAPGRIVHLNSARDSGVDCAIRAFRGFRREA